MTSAFCLTDDGDELADSHDGLGSGGSGPGPGVVLTRAFSNTSNTRANTSVAGASNGLVAGKHPGTISPGSRRKLTLTPELERKSPMIGRRGLDISEQFLRNFSDSSSAEEGDELDDGVIDVEEMGRYSVHMPVIERQLLKPKLSVIREEVSPHSTLQRIKSKETTKLKLIIKADGIDADTSLGPLTPVTPGKYSSNWDEFTIDDSGGRNSKPSSWTSDPASAKADGERTSSSETSDDVFIGAFNPSSLISPTIVSKKIDRRSGNRKKLKAASSGYNPSRLAEAPASAPFSYPASESVDNPSPGVVSPASRSSSALVLGSLRVLSSPLTNLHESLSSGFPAISTGHDGESYRPYVEGSVDVACLSLVCCLLVSSSPGILSRLLWNCYHLCCWI